MNMRILLLFGILLFSRVAEAQWERTNGPYGGSGIHCLAATPENLFSLTSETGIYRLSDKGIGWIALNTGLQRIKVFTLAASGSNLFVGTDSGLFLSIDQGSSWKVTGLEKIPIHSLTASGLNLYAASDDGRIFHSIDNGKSWIISEVSNISFRFLTASDANVYTGAYSGIFHSANNGGNWSRLTIPNANNYYIVSCAASHTNVFAGTTQDGVIRSTDNGNSWRSMNNGLKNYDIGALAVSGSYIFAGTSSGIYLSSNDEESWNPAGLTDVSSFAVYGDYLYAGTASTGVWRRHLSEMIPSSVPSSNHTSQFHLAQNYPNPFSERTTVGFDIPERTFVTLKVYDITGREVAVLANETMDAGSYTRIFNAEGLTSGTYICRIEAGTSRGSNVIQLMR
jgi:photosystem II stability/assembly factor-like uncharacterized protein